MAKKKVQKQEDRSEIHMLLLGMVAVLAIVGLVLMFNARMATGKVSYLPNPEIVTPTQACAGAPACPDGSGRTMTGQDTSQMTQGVMTYICSCPITGVEDYRLTVQLPK
ncbi:hypothetical protein KY329_01825 [Candidatus Woesearchaeota archaeon]|nr:hypothetical protein [Candidatus Woesearchaeota archaeon]